jgi:iron complex transport system substrate-binding protein
MAESFMFRKTEVILFRLFFLILLTVSFPVHATVSVKDDLSNIVTVQQPARRIITFSPHAMELVCTADGCDQIVGKGSYSFYPPVDRVIPEISDNRQFDVERVIALKPDLVVLWRYGISQRLIEQIRNLGIPVFISDPRKLDNIPDSISRLGKLLGTEDAANNESMKLRNKLTDLKARYAKRQIVRVFYQVSDRPLYTLNDAHIVSEGIRLCGGMNVFGSMKVLAPQINIESVLQANPDVIIHTSVDEDSEGLAFWKKYPIMKAVQHNHLFKLNPDLLDRPGPRLIDGVKELCEAMDMAR